jgi:hypothetical protein
MRKLITIFLCLYCLGIFSVNATKTPSFQTVKMTNDITVAKRDATNQQIEQKIRSAKKEPLFSATKQPMSVADLESAHEIYMKRLESAKANKKRYISKVIIRKSTTPDAATVTLNVDGYYQTYDDNWNPIGYEEGGFQMFLDPDCELNYQNVNYYGDFFDICEYHIPDDATYQEYLTNTSIVSVNTQGSITVPQGYYNFIIVDVYQQGNTVHAATWGESQTTGVTYSTAVANNFHFMNGYEYIFTVDESVLAHYDGEGENDAALVSLTVPESSTSLTNSESITVRIANRGKVDFSSVNLSYQINDGNIVTETYDELVPVGEEREYTFNTKADFSVAGIYNIKARVTYDNDLDSRNDVLTASTKHTATIELPFINRFDSPGDFLYWTNANLSDGNTTWTYDSDNLDADGNIGCIQAFVADYQMDEDWNPTFTCNGFLVSDPLNFVNAGNYNIRFQFALFGNESVRILCGTTNNPLEMDTIVDYPLLQGYLWDFRAVNFTIDEPGVHYVAFQYYSKHGEPYIDEDNPGTSGGVGINIDNIIVDTGIFVGIPDLEIVKIVSPASACDMTDGSPISVKVKNIGTEPISYLTLSYQINDSIIGEEFINYASRSGHQIGINEDATIYFTTDGFSEREFDFSALGEYTVKIIGKTDDDKNEENDTFATTIVHYEPLTAADLPFVSDFMNPQNRKEWSSTEGSGWLPNEQLGCLWPERERVPLLSRCITLDSGQYRFDYSYTAGWEIMGFRFIDNFYVTYGKVGERPLTWTPVKSYKNMITYGSVIDDDIILNITEPGDYVVAVVSTYLGDLAIWRTSISEVKTHDVKVKNVQFTETFPRIIPKKHFAGNKTFPVTVTNRGLSIESGSISASVNGTSVGQINFYVEPYKDTTILLTVNLAELPADNINMSITAAISDDGTPSDNTVFLNKIISDSTFAFDNTNDDLLIGFGTGGTEVRVGLIYELTVPDTLTSINVGFCPSSYDVNFGLAVYPVANDSTVGDAYFSVQQRNVSGVSNAYSVPNTILEPGRYFFEVRDLSQNSFYIASDAYVHGHFYVKEANSSELQKIEGNGLGYIHVRPNFGSIQPEPSDSLGIKDIQASNANMFVYPNPNTGEFTVAVSETSTIDIFNATGVKVVTQSVSESANFLLKQSGVYMVKATAKNGRNVITKKIVVK